MMVETYLRRGQRTVQRLMLDPNIRLGLAVVSYGGGGLLLSGASLAGGPQPLAVGLICAGTGWRALMMSLGAMVGYPAFWGRDGRQGIVWAASAGMLALLLGKREESKAQPLMIPAIAAFLTALTGLVFLWMLGEQLTVSMFCLRTALTFCAGVLFTQAAKERDAVTDWLIGMVAVLALARIAPASWLGLGYVAAGLLGVRSSFPAAALAGLGLDLAQVTAVPMTAVMCATYLIRRIPFDLKWQHYASPGFACAAVMAACGIWDTAPLPGLVLGGSLAALLPPQPGMVRRRGETGVAQVRLELGAEAMAAAEQVLAETQPPSVDREAIFQRARDRCCGSCAHRETCHDRENLTIELLKEPSDGTCKASARLQGEMFRARDQLRSLLRERQRLAEYRGAVRQQYRFLEVYMRHLADQLPRSNRTASAQFRVEAAARSHGKERANGDRCMAFPGPGCRYYLLLCDGMGTGLGAAREGDRAARMLRQLLGAGFPPEHSLRTINSMLVLRGAGAAVTMDLAEVHLDTGLAAVYKWGASPSWILRRAGPEKIGTATPPPGLTLEGARESVEKLSLCRGEALILLSDGVDGEDVLHRLSVTPDAPPGELAADILEKCCCDAEDDATAAVIRLRPVSLGTS